jgi:hypothetical protein
MPVRGQVGGDHAEGERLGVGQRGEDREKNEAPEMHPRTLAFMARNGRKIQTARMASVILNSGSLVRAKDPTVQAD